VLDVAAYSGSVAIPAARAGARAIASDLTPELFEAGQKWAAELGVQLTWETADAEALPYPDGEFDAVLSALGVMFAPHHQTAADELARVCRPGGTIGLASWTPAGFIGQMFATMKPYAHCRRREPNRRRCGDPKITFASCWAIESTKCTLRSGI
jgi:ubiquinone/menaquinone biosynthesis C-methylase UbiE